ncbi:MAG: type II toxin-antitoxin system CcdA family antitoxin [Euryarchaeota archaeon]|nr:type II toxin-antitoxin system CcdA family antitoxin [Euryarchaeota archaeon]
MSKYITISAKVRRDLVEEARRLDINISELIRRAIEEEVRKRKLMLLEKRLREKQDIFKKIDVNEIINLIREDREAH